VDAFDLALWFQAEGRKSKGRRQELRQQGEEQHAAGRGEDGERGDRLREVYELRLHLRLLVAGERAALGGLGQELTQLARSDPVTIA
jgi:hypothetical protein